MEASPTLVERFSVPRFWQSRREAQSKYGVKNVIDTIICGLHFGVQKHADRQKGKTRTNNIYGSLR